DLFFYFTPPFISARVRLPDVTVAFLNAPLRNEKALALRLITVFRMVVRVAPLGFQIVPAAIALAPIEAPHGEHVVLVVDAVAVLAAEAKAAVIIQCIDQHARQSAQSFGNLILRSLR